jgi:hypothetical protein
LRDVPSRRECDDHEIRGTLLAGAGAMGRPRGRTEPNIR